MVRAAALFYPRVRRSPGARRGPRPWATPRREAAWALLFPPDPHLHVVWMCEARTPTLRTVRGPRTSLRMSRDPAQTPSVPCGARSRSAKAEAEGRGLAAFAPSAARTTPQASSGAPRLCTHRRVRCRQRVYESASQVKLGRSLEERFCTRSRHGRNQVHSGMASSQQLPIRYPCYSLAF